MLAADDAFERAFDQAIALHERTLDAFETAPHPARVRRPPATGEAACRRRQELRAALETFERLGAEPWAEQARAELAATGETARRRDPSTLDDLTPQELQIARCWPPE